MTDLILTGASRGIGNALAIALSRGKKYRILLVARSSAKLDALAAQVRHRDCQVLSYVADLSSVQGARALGRQLADVVQPGATLVHNAGVWPSQKELTFEGYEVAFATNCLGPLALQEPLLEKKLLARVLVVGAGLMSKGRFDAARTPRGADFSPLRTYCSTKLALAVAMRDVAAHDPQLDVAVVHPGVVRTELGAREGVLGSVLSLVKRTWQSPSDCAARLVRVLDRPRWSTPGEARWLFEEAEQPWPAVATETATRDAVRAAIGTLTDARSSG